MASTTKSFFMRAVIQRVSNARVVIDDVTVGEIGPGLLVLLGVESTDTQQDIIYLAEKTMGLRIFPDDEGKMNRSVMDGSQEILVVSQFTLFGDCRKGRRPSFITAAPPEKASEDYQDFVAELIGQGANVQTGQFQADMQVHLVNDGPVTLLLDSRKQF